jgi:serine/threonine protein kinase
MDNLIGRQFNNYRLVKLLDQGTFAQVYLAEHVYLKTLAAVKVLKMLLSGEQTFLREAQTIARLRHPHIVPIFDCGIEDGIPFLVMAYAPYGSMAHQFKGCRLPMADILRYTSQAAAALQYAHDQRVVHRDVKPGNMLLGPNHEVWLSDFNLSLTMPNSRPLSLQEALGTPYYMAPEQINGKPCPASDQYALGVMVYEWLSGIRPFTGSSYGELFLLHLSEQPPPLRKIVPLIPSSVEAVVFRALEKDPEQRFPSVQAFADALQQAYESKQRLPGNGAQIPIGNNKQTSQKTKQQHRLTRRTILAGLGCSGGVLVLAGGTVAYVSNFGNLSRAVIGLPPTSSVSWQSKGTPAQQATRTPQSAPTPIPGTTITTYSGHSQEVKALVWSPDGSRVASGSLDGTVQLWDAATGKIVMTYGSLAATQPVKTIAWSSDGMYLAAGNGNGTVRVWNVTTQQEVLPQAYSGHTSAVRSVAWQPNGTLLASASQDGTVQVWNGLTGQRISSYSGHSGWWVLSVAWSPDGKYVASGGTDKTVRLSDALTGQQVFSTYTGHTDEVWSVAWSPHGDLIASASQDGTVQVWNASTEQQISSYTVASNPKRAESVAWSPDGTFIAAGSDDGTVQIWNITTQQLVLTYHQQSKTIWSVAWSPDGKRIASASADGTVKVWWA